MVSSVGAAAINPTPERRGRSSASLLTIAIAVPVGGADRRGVTVLVVPFLFGGLLVQFASLCGRNGVKRGRIRSVLTEPVVAMSPFGAGKTHRLGVGAADQAAPQA